MNESKAKYHIYGAIRKAFAWYAPQYKEAILKATVRTPIKDKNNNPTGRFKEFVKCAICGELFYKKDIHVDHIDPVGKVFNWPIDETFLKWFNRLWCSVDNLQALCGSCHKGKTALDKKAGK